MGIKVKFNLKTLSYSKKLLFENTLSLSLSFFF